VSSITAPKSLVEAYLTNQLAALLYNFPTPLIFFANMSVDYLLHESSVGYAIFQVVHQPDTVGNRLKEVQDSVQVGPAIDRLTKE